MVVAVVFSRVLSLSAFGARLDSRGDVLRRFLGGESMFLEANDRHELPGRSVVSSR